MNNRLPFSAWNRNLMGFTACHFNVSPNRNLQGMKWATDLMLEFRPLLCFNLHKFNQHFSLCSWFSPWFSGKTCEQKPSNQWTAMPLASKNEPFLVALGGGKWLARLGSCTKRAPRRTGGAWHLWRSHRFRKVVLLKQICCWKRFLRRSWWYFTWIVLFFFLNVSWFRVAGHSESSGTSRKLPELCFSGLHPGIWLWWQSPSLDGWKCGTNFQMI